jgi:plastocyanin
MTMPQLPIPVQLPGHRDLGPIPRGVLSAVRGVNHWLASRRRTCVKGLSVRQGGRLRQCRMELVASGLMLMLSIACSVGAAPSTSMPHSMTAAVAATPVNATVSGERSGPEIVIEHFMFGPATLTVPVGTTVTWLNHDDDLHTVTAVEGRFASPGLDSGEEFSYRFTTPGTFTYTCALHPQMAGTIIVQ